MAFAIEPFKRQNMLLRMLLMGPTGAGKTLGALTVATSMFDGGLKVGVLDTEHGRAKLYADRFGVHAYGELTGDFSPEAYRDAMVALTNAGCDCVVVDSASHEWMGSNGILQQVDRFGDWKTVRPKHNGFIEATMGLNAHVIFCVRAKMKFDVSEEEVNGRTKQVIRKLGLGPVQSDDILYEFDVVGIIDVASHECSFSNRCEPLVDTTRMLDVEVAEILTTWLSEGEPPPAPEVADADGVAELEALLVAEGIDPDLIEKGFLLARRANRGQIHPDWLSEKLAAAHERAAKRAAEAVASVPVPPELDPEPDAALGQALDAALEGVT